MLKNTFMEIESVETDAQVVQALKKCDAAIREIKDDIREFERLKENIDDYIDDQEQLNYLLKDTTRHRCWRV